MTDTLYDAQPTSTVKIREAAEILGVSQSNLYTLARTTGQIAPGVPILRIGTSLRIPRERLMAYAAGELSC